MAVNRVRCTVDRVRSAEATIVIVHQVWGMICKIAVGGRC